MTTAALVLGLVIFCGVLLGFEVERRRAERERVVELWTELTIDARAFATAMTNLSLAAERAGKALSEFGRAYGSPLPR